MADRPFKNFFAARDALDAELFTDKLTLTSVENLVFRYCLEHALYKPNHNEADYGLLPDDYLGIPMIAKLTGLSERSVRNALSTLRELGLIKTFKRPVMSGGRKPDRIRVDWMLPEEALHAPSEEAPGAVSYEAPGAASYEARRAASIYKEEEGFQEVLEEVHHQEEREPLGLPLAPGYVLAPEGMTFFETRPGDVEVCPVYFIGQQVMKRSRRGADVKYVTFEDYNRLFAA